MSSLLYEPAPRHGHGAVEYNGKVYMWGGKDESWNIYPATDVEIFDICTLLWEKKPSSGTPPPAVVYNGYTRLGSSLYTFGGWREVESKNDIRCNSLHKLDLKTLVWKKLTPKNPSEGPSAKEGSVMIPLGKDKLIVFGGMTADNQYTNELHVYSLNEGTWSCPETSGVSPDPRAWCSFTQIDAYQAVLFGGWVKGRSGENDLYILNMNKWHWRQVTINSEPIPARRCFHSACCMRGHGSHNSQLLVVGGFDDNMKVLGDCWILDLTQAKGPPFWKQVECCDAIGPRRSHVAVAVSSTTDVVQIVIFGGKCRMTYTGRKKMHQNYQVAATAVLQFEADKGNPQEWRVVDSVTTNDSTKWNGRVKYLHKIGNVQTLMKNKQTLRMKAPNILFVGPPLVGKTTLKERIIKGPSWVVSPKSSTPIVAAPISVVSKKLSPDVVALSKSCWTQLELEEQKAFIVLRASERVPVYQLVHTEKELPAFQKQFKQERMEIANVSDHQNTLLTSKTIYSSQQSLQSLPENRHTEIATSTLCKDHTAQCFLSPSFDDLFREVLPGCIPSSQVYKRLQDVLHGSSIVQMLDTGGQPAFLEILPALLSGQSINLLVFKLNERLNDRYKVHYNSPDGKATESYDSSFTVEDVLFQAISSVTFRIAPPFVTKGLTPTSLPSKTIFVGTHMDQVSDYSVVKTTSDILQQKLKCTEIPELDFMNCSTEIGNSVIVPIDNTSPTDPGIHILQDMLDMIMKKDFPDIEFPLSWLMFYFTIRSKKVKFISFEECVQIGKHYSIDEEELRLALWYLSCFFGTLRWYPEVGDIVICDIQVVFDSITNLVSRTFYSKYCTTSEIEFKRTGQILVSKAENLLAECSPIPLPQLVKLLEWLHILTPMYKAGKVHKYFLPCVLPSFPVEDMTSHAITSHHPIPLLFTFEFGYCPIGLFSALVVHLASIKDDSGMMWMLCDSEHELYRNKITYYVGKDYDEVTLIARPTFYEVTVVERKRNRRQEHLHDVCEKIQSTINAAISRVKVSRTSPLELAHNCAFYCTNCHDTNVLHTAKVLDLSSGLATCSFKNTIIELSPEHLIWFGQAHCTQILKENDLNKLYNIVRNTAPRWKTIGLALGFLQSELEIIEMKPLLIPTGVTAYLQEMLYCWLKWSPPKHCFPTTESIANALRVAGEEATAHNLPKLMETIATTPLQQANISWTEVESTKV